MSLSGVNAGYLDVRNAILRVGTLDVQTIVSGVDTATNIAKTNTILLWDDQGSDMNSPPFILTSATRSTSPPYLELGGGFAYAGIKLPNAWLGAFEVYMSDKTDGSIKLHTYTTDTTTYGDTGYELVLDNSGVTLNYDGAQVATAAYTWTNDTWHQVVVGFERGAWTVSVDGTPTLIKDDIEREAVYANVGQYLRIDAASATTTKRVRYVKFAANGQWLQSNTGALSYTQGNVGIGVTNPARTFHVRGQQTVWRLDRDRNSAALHMHRFPTGDWTAPWKGYALGVDASGVDTGEFFIGDYGTAVSGGQTRRLTIDNTGNVIIGTETTGSHLLDVYGTANTGALTTTSASITDVTHSTSKDTGALLVTDGGLGVESNIHSTNVFAASHVGVGTTATSYNLDVAGTANVGAITMNSNVYAPNLQVAQVASNLVTWNSATGDFMDSGGLISNKFAVVSAMPPRQMTDYTDVIDGHGRFKLSRYSNRRGFDAYNIIGPNDSSIWRSGDSKKVIGEYTAHSIALEFPYKVVARSVAWKSPDFRHPREGHVLASNDNGVTWDTLFSFSDPRFDVAGVKFHESLNNSTAYKIYAFAVTAHDDASTTINNLQFFTESFSVDGGIVTTTAASGLETGFTEHPVAPIVFDEITGVYTSVGKVWNATVDGHGTYEITASSFYTASGQQARPPWRLFNHNPPDGSYWQQGYGTVYNASSPYEYTGTTQFTTDVGGTRYLGHWVQIKVPYAITLSHTDVYRTPESVFADASNRAPGAGVFLGSNDGENWYKLTEFSGASYASDEKERVNINATTPYQYYRFVITNIVGGNSQTVVNFNEWRLFSATGVTKMDNVLISGELAVDGGALQTSHIKWPKVPLKANESEGYVASASSVYNTTNFEAWHAFEDKPQYSGSWGPAWLAKIYTFIQSTGEPDTANCATFDNTSCEWIQITQPEAIQLSSFHFKSRLLAEAPKNGSMYGSNDDFITYDKIVSFSGNTQQSAKVDVQSTKRYKSFRLVITQIIGYHYPSIDELQLFESTLGVGTSATTAKLTVDGGLGLAKGSQVFAGSDVITEFPKHDRPLTKYPEVAMTANSSGGYVVDRSTVNNSGWEVWEMFNGIKYTSSDDGWHSANYVYLSATGEYDSTNKITDASGVDYEGEWTSIMMPKAVKLSYFKLYSRTNLTNESFLNRLPKDGTLLGSQDGTTWYKIYSFTDRTYQFSNKDNYFYTNSTKYYKHFVLVYEKLGTGYGGIDNSDAVNIGEWELYGTEEGDESVDIVHRSIPNTPGQQQLAVYYEARDPNSYSFADSTKVYDLSGSGATGTITGNNGFDAEYNAWVFDGSGDYIESPTLSLSGDAVHSISVWFKATYIDSYRTVANITNTTTNGEELTHSGIRVVDGKLNGFFYSDDLTSDATIHTDVWYHAVTTYKGGGSNRTNRKMYLNGVEIIDFLYDSTTGGNLNLSSPTLCLGRDQVRNLFDFSGKIANARVFGKALNADQVRELYEYDAERFGHRQNLVALHKGNLGVGVTNPTSRFEVAGADGLQEFPPKAMTGYETYMEGHGVFRASSSPIYATGDYRAYKAFDKVIPNNTTTNQWVSQGASYDDASPSSSPVTSGGAAVLFEGTYGSWIQLSLPYKILLKKMVSFIRLNRDHEHATSGIVYGSNDGGGTYEIVYTFEDVSVSDVLTDGVHHEINATKAYSMYTFQITKLEGQNTFTALGELKFFGTPAPSSLEDGHLTLGKALTLPRVSGHPAGAETPRAESLVVHYDTTVDSVVSGSTVVDISGNGINGTLNGDAAYSSTDRAFSFDGVNDYVSGTLNNPAGAWVHSVSCWWKTSIDPGTNYDTIFSIGDFTATEFTTFYIKSNSILVSIYGSGALFPFSLQVDRWYHSTVVMRGTTSSISDIDFYLDGVKLTSSGQFGTATTRALPANASLRLGREVSGGGNFLTGSIANFKLWNVALTAEEVAAEYALGRTGKSINLTDTALCLGGTVPRAQLDVRGSAVVDGFVGIGTTNPTAPLHVLGAGGFTDNSATNLSTSVSKAKLRFQNRIGSSLSQYHGTTNSGYSWYQQIANGDGTTSYDLVLNPFGSNVGIGTDSPGETLHVVSDRNTRIHIEDGGSDNGTYFPGLIVHGGSSSNDQTVIFGVTHDANTSANNTNRIGWHGGYDDRLYFNYLAGRDDYGGGDTVIAYIKTNGSYTDAVNFTGQHRTFIKDTPFMRAKEIEGLIVSADNNKYIKMSGGIEAGSNAITMNESLPVVSLSTKVNDKKCFGVISASEDPETREDGFGNFVSIAEKELGDTRVYINSVGEGAMWVVNTAGPLESGDYITTSNVAGYGQRQDDDILHNYTVAKITMDCDFEPPDIPVQRILKELSNITYWYQLEDATSNAYDRTQEETYYTLDRRVEVYGHVDEQSNVFVEPVHDLELYTKTQENIVSEEVYNALPEDEQVLYDSNTFTYTQVTELVPDVWGSLDTDEQNTYVHGYFNIVTDEVPSGTPGAVDCTRTLYKKIINETKVEPATPEDYFSEVRQEWVNVLDAHGQLQWEDVPWGETEPAYKIRYLDASGQITTRHNEVYRAAFVGVTYHCG
jgi:hypothetical protein